MRPDVDINCKRVRPNSCGSSDHDVQVLRAPKPLLRRIATILATLLAVACGSAVESPVGPNACSLRNDGGSGPTRRLPPGTPLSERNDPTITHMRDLMQGLGHKIVDTIMVGPEFGEHIASAYLEAVRELAERDGRDTAFASDIAAAQVATVLHGVIESSGDLATRAPENFARMSRLAESLANRSTRARQLVEGARLNRAPSSSARMTVPADSAFLTDGFFEIGWWAGDTVGTITNALASSTSARDWALQLTSDTTRARQLVEGEAAIDSTRSAIEWMSLTAWIQSDGTLFPSFSCSRDIESNSVEWASQSVRVDACPWCASLISWGVRTAAVAFTGAAGGILQDIMFGDGQDMAQAAGQGAASSVLAWGIGLGFMAIGNVYGRVMAEIIQTWLLP